MHWRLGDFVVGFLRMRHTRKNLCGSVGSMFQLPFTSTQTKSIPYLLHFHKNQLFYGLTTDSSRTHYGFMPIHPASEVEQSVWV